MRGYKLSSSGTWELILLSSQFCTWFSLADLIGLSSWERKVGYNFRDFTEIQASSWGCGAAHGQLCSTTSLVLCPWMSPLGQEVTRRRFSVSGVPDLALGERSQERV